MLPERYELFDDEKNLRFEEGEDLEKKIKREIQVLKVCKSDYVVSCLGSFLEKGELSVIMEFMDVGSLEDIYKNMGPVPEEIICKISFNVSSMLVLGAVWIAILV